MTTGGNNPKYATVDSGLPVPIATAVTHSAFESHPTLPTATKVNVNEKSPNNEEDGITITWEKGEVQPVQYRDKWFAVAFLTHLFAVVGAAVAIRPTWNLDVSEDELTNGESNEDGMDVDLLKVPPVAFWLTVVAISLVAAPALSLCAFTIMNRNAVGMINASLWISVGLCSLATLIFFVVAPPAGIIYGIFTGCLICYARGVQNRIPYAASNLKCGITVINNNLGLGIVSFLSMVLLFVYSATWVWSLAVTMSLDAMKDDSTSEEYYNESTGGQTSSQLSAVGGFVGLLYMLSFYWTHQVFNNIVRTTVSGVVGTWWFSPIEATSFCSTGVSSSLIRSTSYSLGSICFGSLIVAILQMIRNSLRRARSDRNGGILVCIAHCILVYIEALAEYFNKWAYIYVGLYGYSYVEGGKRVFDLFKTRGWQTIIADNLVNRLLGIVALTIGILTGVCSIFASFLVEEFESMQGWLVAGFFVGFFTGLILSGIFMGLLSSAVDAVIVCFAEAPKELEENHPTIAQEMSHAWAEAWGADICGPVVVGSSGGHGVV